MHPAELTLGKALAVAGQPWAAILGHCAGSEVAAAQAMPQGSARRSREGLAGLDGND